MAAEPPTPKTHFTMVPAKPKGTLADYDAGNLPPPAATKETTVPHGRAPLSKTRRRRPNPPKAREQEPDTSDIPEQGEEFFRNATLKTPAEPYERVLADLEFKRDQIDIAIKALRELYE